MALKKVPKSIRISRITLYLCSFLISQNSPIHPSRVFHSFTTLTYCELYILIIGILCLFVRHNNRTLLWVTLCVCKNHMHSSSMCSAAPVNCFHVSLQLRAEEEAMGGVCMRSLCNKEDKLDCHKLRSSYLGLEMYRRYIKSHFWSVRMLRNWGIFLLCLFNDKQNWPNLDAYVLRTALSQNVSDTHRQRDFLPDVLSNRIRAACD